MALLCRSLFHVGKKFGLPEFKRSITLSPVSRLKEIIERKEGKTLTIEAKILPDPNDSRFFKATDNDACPLCALGLEIKHTDVLILSQFLRSDGCVIPRRLTGLCSKQQRRLESLVAMAQKAGLMSNLTPHWSNKDPKKRYKWKKYNTYFDEKTIKVNYPGIYYRE
ncbi:28S ribosomal protein S18a, mitochondrial [Venturia canescens]|uniref:28S ribosomal protein S18a, mitochondrial n=1 Tax=Venturia canescens TaxID=32260 RepID=UPI001C9C45FA|nr:28S ribosomal protein S18a, mitochondrial [Venturia canescens]